MATRFKPKQSQSAFFVLLIAFGVPVIADDVPKKDVSRKSGDRTESINLEELPKPSDQLAKLIEDAKVTFYAGRKPWAETMAARERNGITSRRKRLAAETKFNLHYEFRSRTKWRVREEGDKRILLMTINYTLAKINHDHELWFRHRPSSQGFWEDRLVQHELDHVRISTNPIVSKTFLSNLRDNRILRRELESDEPVNQANVQTFVDEHVEKVFQEIVSLVGIRYKELDRVTDHGLTPIPQESEIHDWMQ